MTERYGWDTTPTPDLGIDPTKASAKIKTLADFVQGKVWGKDVASAYKQGLLQAGVESRDALDRAKSAQAQVDVLVVSGDSSVEAAQARVDTNAYTYSTLKSRLDTEHQEVTAQLAQNAIVVSREEPTEAIIWYEDRGKAPINFENSGIAVKNAELTDSEPSDTQKLWFDKNQGGKVNG